MERRSEPRQRTFLGASIARDRAPDVDCIVRNMSRAGACLELQGPAVLPDEFSLLIRPAGVRRACRLVWQKAQRSGVRFL